jgi:hypothetical protein
VMSDARISVLGFFVGDIEIFEVSIPVLKNSSVPSCFLGDPSATSPTLTIASVVFPWC